MGAGQFPMQVGKTYLNLEAESLFMINHFDENRIASFRFKRFLNDFLAISVVKCIPTKSNNYLIGFKIV